VTPKIQTRILETVRALFLKPVYSETRLKQIAQIAKVTEGSIYRLFGDRVQLNQCVLGDTLAKAASATRKLVAERGVSDIAIQDVADAIGLAADELRILFPTMEQLTEHSLGARKDA
jgi:AcrR family transcriptional regulator